MFTWHSSKLFSHQPSTHFLNTVCKAYCLNGRLYEYWWGPLFLFLSLSFTLPQLSLYLIMFVHISYSSRRPTLLLFSFWSHTPSLLTTLLTYSAPLLCYPFFSNSLRLIWFFSSPFTPSTVPISLLFIFFPVQLVFDVSFCITQCCTSWSFILSFLVFMLRCFVVVIFLCCFNLFHLHVRTLTDAL